MLIGREVLNFLKGGAVEDTSEAHVVALRCAFVGAGGWLIPFIGDNMKFDHLDTLDTLFSLLLLLSPLFPPQPLTQASSMKNWAANIISSIRYIHMARKFIVSVRFAIV